MSFTENYLKKRKELMPESEIKTQPGNNAAKSPTSSGDSFTSKYLNALEHMKSEASNETSEFVMYPGLTPYNGTHSASDGSMYTPEKTERKPGDIQALGAGSYGTNRKTRFDSAANAAIYGTASGLAKSLSLYGGAAVATPLASAINPDKVETGKENFKAKSNQFANDLQDSYEQNYNEAVDGLGFWGQLAVDAGINLAQMGMDALTGPAALATMATRAAGSRALELEDQGYSENQQALGGFTSGVIEALTEKIAGPFEKIYGKTIAGNATRKLINRLGKTSFGRAALKRIAGIVGEGAEEVLSDYLNPIMDRITGISDEDWSWQSRYGEDWLENWAYDFAVGGILGGLGVEGQAIASSANANRYYGSREIQQALVNKGLEASPGTDARRFAEEYQQLLDNDKKKLRGYQIAEQVEANEKEKTIGNAALDAADAIRAALNTDATAPEQNANIPSAQPITQMETAGSEDIAPEVPAPVAKTPATVAQAEPAPVAEPVVQQSEATQTEIAQPEVNTITEEAKAAPAAAQATQSVEDFSNKYGKSAPAVQNIYALGGTKDVAKFSEAFDNAYQWGKSGVPISYAMSSNATADLTEEQRKLAWQMGADNAATNAASRGEKIEAGKKQGNLLRKGTVKAENGVSLADIRSKFNDRQNIAYKTLSTFAEATGVDIVVYSSKPDSSGNFPATQGKFRWKDNTIYIDMNGGLFDKGDINDLGKYTALRTFAHEFTHFIEKWNPVQYNEFRSFVFQTIQDRGENVDDLITEQLALDESGKLTYEQASREVVADAMTDILPDTDLVQQLAEEHKTIFDKLLEKLQEFVANIKAFYNGIKVGDYREARALKEQVNGEIKYLDDIVKQWTSIAKTAVENYQMTFGEEISEAAPAEETPVVSETEPAQQQDIVYDDFKIMNNAERGSIEIKFNEKPAENVREILKSHKFRWGKTKGVWYGYGDAAKIGNELDAAYKEKPAEPAEPADTLKTVVKIYGIECTVEKGYYTFTVPGWEEATVYGKKAAERTIRGRLDAAVRNTLGIDKTTVVSEKEEAPAEQERPEEIPQAATVSEIIETVQETPSVEAIPPKTETEAAKKKLAKAVKMPIQGTNEEAILKGIETGELSIDSVTLPGNVEGFNLEQRAFLVRSLIEGVYSDAATIKVDVPFDGKFEIENSHKNVAAILGKLKVKVTQDVEFTKELISAIGGKGEISVAQYNGQSYITDGSILFAISDSAYYYVKENANKGIDGLKVRDNIDESVIRNLVERDYERISTAPAEVEAQSGKKKYTYYAFETSHGTVYFDKRYVKHIDRSEFYVSTEPAFGKEAYILKSVDENGNAVAYVFPVRMNGNITSTKPSKLKAFSEKKTKSKPVEIKEETDNGKSGNNTPGNRSNGQRAARLLETVQAADVQGAGEERSAVADSGTAGTGAGRNDNPDDAERSQRGHGEGSSQSTDIRRDGGLSAEEETQQAAEQLREEISEQIEQQSKEQSKGSNFVIGDSLNLPNGAKARFRANVDAIKLVKQLVAEGRYATTEEQEVLSKYVGWGGLSEAFDEKKSEWAKEYAELKELLTDDEYKTARGSTLNAHYTDISVIKAMYKGLAQLGFNGGRMLEPSSGVGNFVGAMPADMTEKVTSWTMVELDNITGLIAKYLYPNADVRIQGFETAKIPDNYMDVAISNVPFGNYPIADKKYKGFLTKAIHNYFFAKSLDKVRPGGIVMFITSSFTMNSHDAQVRKYIAKQADLLGAIRLPSTAFKGNAGTEVVTDILVLRKRAPNTEYAGESFENSSYQYISGYNGAYVNDYFQQHPEMVMGKAELTRGMYRADELTYTPYTDRGTLQEQIEKAFENIKGKMSYPAKLSPEKTNFAVERAEKKGKPNGYVSRNGKIYIHDDNGNLQQVEKDDDSAARITGMLEIRDAARELLNAQQQGQTKASKEALRKKLNSVYDSFVKKHGYLNSPKNKKAFESDPDKYSLFALENFDSKTKKATKADIFSVDTVAPNITITTAENVAEGLIVSRNVTGGVDVPMIARLTSRTEADVERELIDSRLAFKDREGELVAAEIYLSGNVRAKLRDAEALAEADEDYKNNVEALKSVMPKDVSHTDIYVNPGTPWVPAIVYEEFVCHMLGVRNYSYYGSKKDIIVTHSNATGKFNIEVSASAKRGYTFDTNNKQKWGINRSRHNFVDIFSAMLNSQSQTVTFKGEDGKTYVDKDATALANEKVEQITQEFQKWLWSDKERTEQLTELYNEVFNAIVTPKYNGEHLTVNGANAAKPLRPHQRDAVQRVISSGGNTLLAHKVGAGKTYEMAAAAMKLKELGIVKKPMFIVPKSLVAQWGNEFKDFFPTARILVAEQSDFTPANRKTFANRIATGSYDAVIVSYEQFQKIPISNDFARGLYQDEIDEIIAAINEAKEEAGKNSLSVKALEKKRKSLEAKIQALTDIEADEDNIIFEDLGIDSLFVDEAHNFKNLFYTTSMQNVSGLGNKDGSKKAFDLYTKVRYLQKLNNGRGIVFATATPVMNSMSEMYIMQKYLQPDLLKEMGIYSFDAWAKQFGEVVNGVEIKPSGQGYRVKQSFSRFKNVPELQLLFRNFADVLTDIPGLEIPKMKDGKVHIVECEPGEFQKEYMKELEKRAENVRNVNPAEDNMLKITSDGRKVSYTQRMIDPSLPYEENGKIKTCVENVVRIYKETTDAEVFDKKAGKNVKLKGTQLIFCDMATPKGKDKSKDTDAANTDDVEIDESSAKLYDDIRSFLVKKGIPAKEIAFIHEADTDAKKAQLFADVNEGKVRVLIGSTGKMGVGMNAQKRIVAIHHLDAPWRPGDVEQRNGRAYRQGNINSEVEDFTYVTVGSFDARLWDILDRKQNFINQIMNGEDVGRDAEDTGEVTLSAAEVKALASGNLAIKEAIELESDIKKLESLKRAHNKSVYEAKVKLADAQAQKTSLENRIANAKKDISTRIDTYSEGKFALTVGTKKYTDKKEAGEALMLAAQEKATTEGFTTIGNFAGFELRAFKTKEGIKGLVSGAQGYGFNYTIDQTTRMVGRIANIVESLEQYIETRSKDLADISKSIAEQEKLSTAEFERENELNTKRARYNEIMRELNPPEQNQQINDEDIEQYSTRRTVDGVYSATERQAVMSNERINVEIDNSRAGSRADYAQAWITSINPTDFLNMTLGERNQNREIFDNMPGEYDSTVNDRDFIVDLKNSRQTPYLNVDISTGEVVGHEGRHRMRSLEKAGIESAEILVRFTDIDGRVIKEINGYGNPAEAIERKTIFNQRGTGQSTDLLNIMPLNNAYRERIFENYGENAASENDISYSTRRKMLSNREVLAMAADSIRIDDLTDGQKDAIRIFNSRLDKLEDMTAQRESLGQQYKEQQFTKGGSRAEAERIKERMDELDGKINAAQNDLLDLEDKDVLKQVLVKARKVIETEERAQSVERLKHYRENRNEAASVKKYRAKVRADVETLRSWLMRPNNKDVRQHIPAEIQKSVADFIGSINFISKRALNGKDYTQTDAKFIDNMNKVRKAIKDNASTAQYSGYGDLPPTFLDEFESLIESVQGHMDANSGEYIVNRMTAAELKDLHKVLKVLKKYITTMNYMHNNAMFQHAYEAGDNSIEYMKELANGKGRIKPVEKASTFMAWQNMRPIYAFERFGDGGLSVYDEFRRGQAQQAFLAKQIISFADEAYTAQEVEEWSKEVKTVTIDDQEVQIPVTAIMSLYCLNKREQARTHIYGDGIRVATFTGENKKNTSDTGHIVTPEDVNRITNELTDRQKEVADKLQRYMSKECSKWGNYVTRARFDVDVFGEENYFPINSDGRYLAATADENPDNAGLYALLNMGFTKELQEGATNRIILYNIFDVFSNHTASMAQYRSFALPVLDALKWFNYQDDDSSVRDEMARVYGAPAEDKPGSGTKGYAEQFVLNMIRAYNGTMPQGDSYDNAIIKTVHHFNRQAVAYNARVVIQQPMAITRAAMYVSPKHLAEGLKMSAASMKALAEEMEAYSGIAAWKSLGFYDTNISRGLTKLIKHEETAIDKVIDVGMKGAEFADRYTWAAMWYACKQEVDSNKYDSEEEYLKAVSDKFEDVIYRTQVVDSILTKSEFLRSKGLGARTLGSFMSEPMTTMSMLTDAYLKYAEDQQRGMSASEAWQNNKGKIGKLLAVYSAGQVLLAAVESIADAWRDDDDYESFMQKWLVAFKNNVIDEILPFNKIPLISQLYSWIAEGYDLNVSWVQWAQYFTKGWDILRDKASGKNTNYTWWGGIYNMLRGVSSIAGLPFASASREVIDIWNNTIGGWTGKKIRTYDAGDKSNIKYAYLDGSLSYDDAIALLLDKGLAKDDNDAYWTIKGWDSDEQYFSKYGELKDALDSGNTAEIRAEVTELQQHGTEDKNIKSSLTGYYKPIYLEASAAERSKIVDALLATGLYGRTRTEVIDYIAKYWLN